MLDRIAQQGSADAAVDYAQQIPPRVIAHLIGIDPTRVDEFVQWTRGVLDLGQVQPELRIKYRRIIRKFFAELVEARRTEPRDDVVSKLIASEVHGELLNDYKIVGICNLLLVAGIDTTWSSIGSALLHFATHAEDRRRICAEPELLPSAIEELLRFYSPVTMARKVTKPIPFGDAEMLPSEKVLLNFPAANRDPEVFERADEVLLDRERNRHIAFGVGIHRCAGSNLTRMEIKVALRKWFERLADFELTDADGVTWTGGQVRGPRNVPVQFRLRD